MCLFIVIYLKGTSSIHKLIVDISLCNHKSRDCINVNEFF